MNRYRSAPVRAITAAGCAVVLLLASCSDGGSKGTVAGGSTSQPTTSATPTTSQVAPYASAVYSDPAHWICAPDAADNTCEGDIDSTVVNSDGSTEVIPATHPESDPGVDCFYVYPTVSTDPGVNSDLVADQPERNTTLAQAARFRSLCTLYAPAYRQVTLGGLFGGGLGGGSGAASGGPAPWEVAYGDVLDAWKYYLANFNHGRPVVLIGHSQGTGHLVNLMAKEIDPNPTVRSLLVSAVLLGGAVSVPPGEDVGGSFQHIPLCRKPGQNGCVITYASFRSTSPPPENSYFGAPRTGTGVAGCVNPATLVGDGSAGDATTPLKSFLPSGAWVVREPTGQPVTTPFVQMPGLLEGRCVTRGRFTYLEIQVRADPADPRADDIGGDLSPEWGLHLVDAHLAMGDLLDAVSSQIDARGDG